MMLVDYTTAIVQIVSEFRLQLDFRQQTIIIYCSRIVLNGFCQYVSQAASTNTE